MIRTTTTNRATVNSRVGVRVNEEKDEDKSKSKSESRGRRPDEGDAEIDNFITEVMEVVHDFIVEGAKVAEAVGGLVYTMFSNTAVWLGSRSFLQLALVVAGVTWFVFNFLGKGHTNGSWPWRADTDADMIVDVGMIVGADAGASVVLPSPPGWLTAGCEQLCREHRLFGGHVQPAAFGADPWACLCETKGIKLVAPEDQPR